MGHEKPAGKKANHGVKRTELERRHAADGMSGSATSRIPRAESDQKAADNDHQNSLEREKRSPVIKFRYERHLADFIIETQLVQFFPRRCGNVRQILIRSGEIMRSYIAAEHRA